MTYPSAATNTTNADAGGDSPATFRGDVLDLLQKFNLLMAMFASTETAMAAAATVDIGGQVGQRIALTTGSGAITSLGTNYGGPIFVRVAVSCSLTYNATTLVTPGAASLTLNAGDSFIAIPKASGGAADGWRIMPTQGTGRPAWNGATPDANSTITLGRMDTSSEGGQATFCRSSDNAAAFAWDVFFDAGTGTHAMRLLDVIAGSVRQWIDPSNGWMSFNVGSAPTSPIDINADRFRVRTQKTPASAAAAGVAGEWCADSSFIYYCTAANTWKRVAIATW